MRALLLVLLSALPAAAQEPPRCEEQRLGTVACIAGRLCECRFERGGQMTGLPDGIRWDCSVLRPACGPGILPATPFPAPGPPQPGVLVLPPRR
jgi:hypothetical protein